MTVAERMGFIKWLEGLEDKNYLLTIIAYGAAPTLLSNKPSTLLSFPKGPRDLSALWNRYKDEIHRVLGLDHFELKEGSGNIRVLFFRECVLEAFIMDPDKKLFLNSMGYTGCQTIKDCLLKLKERFQAGCPHEIGLFLGFPVKDVVGFIRNKGRNCLLCRYWKVYDNAEQAKQIFSLYDEARNEVIKRVCNLIQ